MLYGRGTTDCLGHVALITELLLQVTRICHAHAHTYA
jgi:acetylornithine deacetylase/succinyl-diaminopimelate desuccinylase-like protein